MAGVYTHTLYAQDKTKSKGTAFLLPFFISNSQWGLQHGAFAHFTASSTITTSTTTAAATINTTTTTTSSSDKHDLCY